MRPGLPSLGQQRFGDGLVAAELFVAIPSVVSTHSWNLLFVPMKAAETYGRVEQERFALDTRLTMKP